MLLRRFHYFPLLLSLCCTQTHCVRRPDVGAVERWWTAATRGWRSCRRPTRLCGGCRVSWFLPTVRSVAWNGAHSPGSTGSVDCSSTITASPVFHRAPSQISSSRSRHPTRDAHVPIFTDPVYRLTGMDLI